jgi:YggT family protein
LRLLPALATVAAAFRARPQTGPREHGKDAEPAMMSVVWLINQVISIYIWVLIIQVIISWLIAFNVINTRNRFVYMVADVAYKLTEPALRPIRRILPNFGGIDLSPVVLILLLGFLQRLMLELVYGSMM